MKIAAILISSIALVISALSFFWNNIRDSKKLFLVPINKIDAEAEATFALVNAGTRNVVITSVEPLFKNADDSGGVFPRVSLSSSSEGNSALKPGESIQYRAKLLQEFDKEFLDDGSPYSEKHSHIIVRNLNIDICWFDIKGESHYKSAPAFKFMFTLSGKVMGREPLNKKTELYDVL